MRKESTFGGRLTTLTLIATVGLVFTLVLSAWAAEKIHIAPRFLIGQTMHYRILTRAATKGTTTTPIANPEAGTSQSLATRLVVRLEVLAAPPADSAATGEARLRATFEEADATAESDAVDPAAPLPGEQFKRMEGRSIEFTIHPGGVLEDVQGLEKIFTSASDAEPMLAWARGLTSSAGFPKRGIEIGQKWTSERELQGLPMAGLQWKTVATYLRDEPCASAGAGSKEAAASGPASGNAAAPQGTAPAGGNTGAQTEMCAVILTQFEIGRHSSIRSEATPDEYRKNGMRTSGKWSGSGESLDSISLATGLLVSSTQTSSQDVDYQITSTKTGSSIHRTGQTTTKTEITLLPAAPAPKS